MIEQAVIDKGSRRLLIRSFEHPVGIMVVLFLGAVLIKVLDTMVFRLDERVGEAIMTKAGGFLLVAAYVWACGRQLKHIGFHRRSIGASLLIGGATSVGLFLVCYTVTLVNLNQNGQQAALIFSAVDPKSGMEGGFLFGLWLIAANLVNSAMEEGLFRGAMLGHFRRRFSVWPAVLLQAGLFAIWHLNWPLKNLLDGRASWGEAGFEAFGLLLATFISGLLYGYMYHKTGNLWGPFLAHLVNNSVLNVLFFQTDAGRQAPTEFGIFLALWLPGHLLLLVLIRWWAGRLNLPEVQPWA